MFTIRNYLQGPPNYIAKPGEKWLPGDRVDPNDGTVMKKELKNHAVVGIVDFINRTGQGFTARGIPLYLFHPLDAGYPPMIVSSKIKYTQNHICIVSIEHWTDKWPRAGIQKTLGPVGDRSVELSALLHRATIPCTIKGDHVESIQIDTSKYRQFEGFAFHIDPDGCEDVDDVIIWNESSFGIGIADVAQWIRETSEMDTFAEQLGQTLYKDGKPIQSMLPTSFSHHLASLRSDGVSRPVLARMYTISEGKVLAEGWELLLVKVNKTYTYDSVYSDAEVCSKLSECLTVLSGLPVGTDSHHWIEVAMILYNRACAEVLLKAGKGLLRQHSGRTSDEWALLAEKTGCNELAYLGYSAGQYVSALSKDVGHFGLGLDAYCHASSPLRRYADLYNQRWLHHLLFQDNAPLKMGDVEQLNHRGKVAKQFDRDCWFLERLRTDIVVEVKGILIRDKSDCWTIYIPEWKRKIRGKSDEEQKKQRHKHSVGDSVLVRAFTDLRATNWGNRIICSFA